LKSLVAGHELKSLVTEHEFTRADNGLIIRALAPGLGAALEKGVNL
jgi:hypothetical protein